MAWQQLHLQCEKANVDLAEALLLEAGALSIALDDAGDQPLFEPLPGESPLWDEVILTGLFDATTEVGSPQVVEQLGHEIAAQVQASRIWLTAVDDKDWEREWMTHYRPIECANNLWIVPNWLKPPNTDATNIIMDPGLAFGTGYHATTRLCLDWLTEQDLSNKVVIDYGCGSGILGIGALLLGARHVYAVDIDPQAVLATNQNAARNHVEDRLQAFLPEAFGSYCAQNEVVPVDVIVANILAKPLIGLAPYFATLIAAKGRIVLAGLIESQTEQVSDAYSPYFALDAKHAYTAQEDQHWQRLSGTFTG
ncbi:50S ribosomal protein L11 methyltransferase [Psychrobacter sp. LV10R520-6]|uniref:50S ribosomal protein L11 methyltransferase n=1 Tax=Psychrobacter sp. LV10R520-6 TaxID=1415574 RepID=UPI0024CDE071|nr:50S ribosomal protein L11 methyltransferase [Psychrobacter sp. LV10R520-6]SNT69476.1 [LSU ribosomal protein L11P]-lysine N-methyltransferase [Psychrobacter sp. LV10R520-6]